MENDYLYKIQTQFKHITLNSTGLTQEIYEMLDKGDVFGVINMMENNDDEVDKAIMEYNPQTHKVMNRPNKPRKNMPAYITEKLPRNKQQYINEIEVFFLLGKPIIWKHKEGEVEAFKAYSDFWDKYRLDSVMRSVKRLAGAETESALVFNLTNDHGNVKVKPFIVARSKGYRLRPLFDQYGDLIAFAYGYRLKEGKKRVLHWDILTADYTFYCSNRANKWSIDTVPNPTGKINAIYFKQTKAWDGAVPRIEREEKLDSKVGDTNNYFADPKAMATADVIHNISDPDVAGNLVQLTGTNSKFEYINPPSNSATRQDEKEDLKKSIFFDTFTPDFSYESIKGLGTLSGAAIHNALVLGYIKKDNRTEIYGELVDRLRSVIFGIIKLQDAKVANKMDSLKIEFEFADPFATQMDNWGAIIKLYGSGLCSLETAIKEIGLVDDVDAEIDRIIMAQQELECAKIEAQRTEEEMQEYAKMKAEQMAQQQQQYGEDNQ